MLAYEYPADGQQCSPYQYPRYVGPVGMRLVVAEQYGRAQGEAECISSVSGEETVEVASGFQDVQPSENHP